MRSPAGGKIYLHKSYYFNLLFRQLEPRSKIPFDVNKPGCQGWKGLLYIKALAQIKVAFEGSVNGEGHGLGAALEVAREEDSGPELTKRARPGHDRAARDARQRQG